jgi:hypothetical protein
VKNPKIRIQGTVWLLQREYYDFMDEEWEYDWDPKIFGTKRALEIFLRENDYPTLDTFSVMSSGSCVYIAEEVKYYAEKIQVFHYKDEDE